MSTTHAVADGNNDLAGSTSRTTGSRPGRPCCADSTPAQAGLDPAPIDAALAAGGRLDPARTAPRSRCTPARSRCSRHDGKVVTRTATGKALKYADGAGTELPADQQVAMRTDTIFDMASVSKLFTSIVVMQQVEAGQVDLDAPIATYVPEFGRERQGGDHGPAGAHAHHRAAGLAAAVERAARPGRRGCRWRSPRRRRNPPGSTYLYSDLNLIALGEVVHRVSGKPLDELVADGITGPAGDAGHRLQPGPGEAGPDRRHGVPGRAAARHGAGLGARRERLVAGRRRRPRRGVLHRRRPGQAGPGAAERRDLRGTADPDRGLGRADDHQLQPGLPGQRPRARLRAEPALVHVAGCRGRGPPGTPVTPGRRW